MSEGLCHPYEDGDEVDEDIDHEFRGVKPPQNSSVIRNAMEKERRKMRKAVGWKSFKLRKSPVKY